MAKTVGDSFLKVTLNFDIIKKLLAVEPNLANQVALGNITPL